MSTFSVLLNIHLISIALSVGLLALRFGGVTPTRVLPAHAGRALCHPLWIPFYYSAAWR